MKIFVLGLYDRPTLPSLEDPNLAYHGYSSQIGDICASLYKRGHEIIHIGISGSKVLCSQNIEVISKEIWENLYVKNIGTLADYIKQYEDGVRKAINNNAEPYTSIVCANNKNYHKNCLNGVQQFVVETCIGYPLRDMWGDRKTFMSACLMNSYYGSKSPEPLGQWYDRVIPPCFDVEKFPFEQKKDDYFVIACRLIHNKGVHIAAELAKKMGFKLKIAGPGDPKPYLIAPNIEYLGVLGPKDRNELLKKAKALFQPTIYLEPFGMVVIEANLCGTPVITTDFGAFLENVNNGVSGYRCNSWADFVCAVKMVSNLDPSQCRKWGERYSYASIAPMYDKYFQSLLDLNGEGWYKK